MRRRDRVTCLLTWLVVLAATAAIWVWVLDAIFHFGYTGDR